jgi:hypothetical protein
MASWDEIMVRIILCSVAFALGYWTRYEKEGKDG